MTNLVERINLSFREVETRMEAGLSDKKGQINSLKDSVVRLKGETEIEKSGPKYKRHMISRKLMLNFQT